MSFVKLFFDPKSPEDVVPFSMDFSLWLDPATSDLAADTIANATVTTSNPNVTNDGTLIATGAAINSGTVVTTTLSGGTAGNTYLVHYLVTSARGLIVQRSATLQVLER